MGIDVKRRSVPLTSQSEKRMSRLRHSEAALYQQVA